MPFVVEDTIANSQARVTREGVIDVRRIHIGGLTPGKGIRLQALAYLKSLDIDIDRPHPDPYGYPLYVREVGIEPFLNSRSEVWATVTYQTPSATHAAENAITFYATVREEETSFGADGNVIKVKYKDPSGKEYEQIGRVLAPQAFGILEFVQEIYDPPGQLLTFENKISSATYEGQPAYTWWIREIVLQKILYRPGIKRVIRMEYDPRTYIKTVAFVDANTGETPGDVIPKRGKPGDAGNGYTNGLVTGTADFNQLKLPKFFTA